ncbi:Lamin-C [Brachionus plicatilis]|uniref:Lamin-C n=1 Tax=Brachionus plicatilis TaxID=10195 RepID=A0A3M7QBT4_BRAPC|nr:Lamin-C [Brachionus plicatilis]
MSSQLPKLRLNERQSLDENFNQPTRTRIRSNSLNPDFKSVRKMMLNNCIPEVHDLNNRLDQLVKKYRNCNTSYFADQTLDEIKSAYQSQFKIWNAKMEKIVEEKTRLDLINHSLSGKLIESEKKLLQLKQELESLVSSLKLQLRETNEKLESSRTDWQNAEAKHASKIEDLELKLVNEKKRSAAMENKISVLQHQLDFKESVFEREVAEYKRISELSHKTVENKIRNDFENHYEVFRNELLEKVAEEKEIISDNLKRYHNSKISQMEADIKRAERRKETAENELQDATRKIQALNQQNETMTADFIKKLQRLEQDRRSKDEALNSLNDENELLRKEFEQVKEETVCLHKEIRKYKKIIEEAERQMNITPNTTSSPKPYQSPELENHQQSDRGALSPIVSSSLIDSSDEENSRKRRRLHIEIEDDPQIIYRNGKFSIEYNYNSKLRRQNAVQSDQGQN